MFEVVGRVGTWLLTMCTWAVHGRYMAVSGLPCLWRCEAEELGLCVVSELTDLAGRHVDGHPRATQGAVWRLHMSQVRRFMYRPSFSLQILLGRHVDGHPSAAY